MGTIELTLTRLKKFLFFRYIKKEKIGFIFSNRAMLQAAESVNIELDKFFDWAEQNRTLYFAEMLYSAYLVWCQESYLKPVFGKSELIYAFGNVSDEKRKDVLKTWADSESFGVKKKKEKESQ